LGAGGGLGGPACPGGNFGGKTSNLGAAPHDWGFAKKFIGAGVYCPQTNAECYVNSGGMGMTNTINRAELTGIAAAQ